MLVVEVVRANRSAPYAFAAVLGSRWAFHSNMAAALRNHTEMIEASRMAQSTRHCQISDVVERGPRSWAPWPVSLDRLRRARQDPSDALLSEAPRWQDLRSLDTRVVGAASAGSGEKGNVTVSALRL